MAEKTYRVGIDLGGTNIQVGVLDGKGALLGKKSGGTDPYSRPWQEVAADMAALAKALLAEKGIALDACASLGVGSPGMIDTAGGTVIFAGNFGWVDVPLLAEMQRHFPTLPVHLANDADAAVLGEAVAGAAAGAQHVVMLTLGTGVGSGVVVDGRPQGGGPGRMEYGHTVIVADGEACTCGAHGCIEAYASATALIRDARRAAEANAASLLWRLCDGSLENMNGEIAFQAAQAKDAAAQQVIENYTRYVGIAVINAINIWRPEKVLLGGGIANAGDALIVPVTEYVRPRVFAGERSGVPPILRAALGNDAGLYGAAAL